MVERELDRELARRFNVFDYLRTDELGLSRMLADLLDPAGKHGQGPLFLNVFLRILDQHSDGKVGQILGLGENGVGGEKVTVETECPIDKNRRIDVVIKIGDKTCLAIENKPYADDQENQVKDYLDFLSKYKSSLLIYLSSQGQDPSEQSIPPNELKCAKIERRLIVLPYSMPVENDDAVSADEKPAAVEDGGLEPQMGSLVDWLAECGKLCRVDRLRWFLQDAATFVNRKFAGGAMAIDSEQGVTRDFVLRNAKNVSMAATLARSWPSVKDEICRRFFDRIVKKVVEKLEPKFGGIQSVVHCEENRKHYRVQLFREQWRAYEEKNRYSIEGKSRYSICLEANRRDGPKNLYWGIRSPVDKGKMNEESRERFGRLVDRSRKKIERRWQSSAAENRWPWWRYCDEYHDWRPLIPKLYEENCSKDGGKITDYFVDLLTDFANLAIPIINEIEAS